MTHREVHSAEFEQSAVQLAQQPGNTNQNIQEPERLEKAATDR